MAYNTAEQLGSSLMVSCSMLMLKNGDFNTSVAWHGSTSIRFQTAFSRYSTIVYHVLYMHFLCLVLFLSTEKYIPKSRLINMIIICNITAIVTTAAKKEERNKSKLHIHLNTFVGFLMVCFFHCFHFILQTNVSKVAV